MAGSLPERAEDRSTYGFQKAVIDEGMWMQIYMFGAFAVFAGLHEYLPPATLLGQFILFLINLPLLGLCAYLTSER